MIAFRQDATYLPELLDGRVMVMVQAAILGIEAQVLQVHRRVHTA